MTTQLAKSGRAGAMVHRIRRIETTQLPWGEIAHPATFLCGGSVTDAVLVGELDALDEMCERCVRDGSLVYRCYSTDGQLLYIGSCVNWPSRENLHKAQTPWWEEVARVEKAPQPDIRIARRMEKAAIRAEAPLHNKFHNIQRFHHAGQGRFVPVDQAA
ncbi:MAG TPA: hypothetical protein VHZ03_14185 [Trebonia sp.]|jgi:hypothetical protein|nr:hypothetical protein [Trebonia sp.]